MQSERSGESRTAIGRGFSDLELVARGLHSLLTMMSLRTRALAVALVVACFSSTRAEAEPQLSVRIFTTYSQNLAAQPWLEQPVAGFLPQDRRRLDYTVFAYELVAYIAKEVLSDSPEEYTESPIGSRLSRQMAQSPSEFGSHCLLVIADLKSGLSTAGATPSFVGTSGTLDYAVEAASAALAIRRLWSAFRDDVGSERSGFALDPKVGAGKIGLKATFRW